VRGRRPGDGHGRRAAALSDPLVLISGLGQGSWVWRWVLPELERGRAVVAFDHRGTGPLADVAPRESVPEMAADVRAELAEPAHVLGFSMGGYVALTLALAEPQLVSSLVLAGTGAGGPDRVARPAHVARAFDQAFGLPAEEFGRLTMPYTVSPGWGEANPERFEEILAARLERPTPDATILAHVAACYAFYDLGLEVERIEAPALVVHGDEDLIVPVENGRRLVARLPNADYVELPGRGHNLMLEDPETLGRLVRDFLDRR
jgi:pimeloyl-ACP methyl ester carboxylesterase